jgi:recombination protein RecT
MSGTAVAVAQKPKFSVALQTPGYQKLINDTLGDPKRAQRFITAISSAVATNPGLQACDPGTILSCALIGESLDLSPSPQLGQYYLVPFNDTKNNRIVATFILGWRGYAQLAMRSGVYKHINIASVKEGEFLGYDPFRETIELKPIKDPLAREVAETIGYYAFFEYLNGFRKELYWSKEKMLQHAMRYAPAVKPAQASGKFPGRVSLIDYQAGNYDKKNEWVYSSFWHQDFDVMAHKTMLRQLIGKWGLMSVEMRTAFEQDGISAGNDVGEFVDGSELNAFVVEMNDGGEPLTGEVIDGDSTEDDNSGGDAESNNAPASEPEVVSMKDI